MADPSPEEIQKLLDLIVVTRKSIEQAGAQGRTALSAIEGGLRGALVELGVDAQGKLDVAAWGRLSPSNQTALRDRLQSTTDLMQNLGSADPGGPTDQGSIMFKTHASNYWIVALTIFGIVLTVGALTLVTCHWNEATQIKPAVPGADGKVSSAEAPKEATILGMIILMGALGGCLHWTSSLAMFIGNGQLLRRWIPYYLIMPFEGAALAPVIYLLLRVGVLNSGTGSSAAGAGSSTANLNLVSLYAFAALTGLFAKQAIEMLADVFTVIFKKVNAKDQIPEKSPKQEVGQAAAGGAKQQ